MELAEQGYGMLDDDSEDEDEDFSLSSTDAKYNVSIVRMAVKLVKEAQVARIDMPPRVRFLL